MIKIKEVFKKINVYTALIVLLAFLLGWQLGHKDIQIQWDNLNSKVRIENQEPPKDLDIDFKLFWDTWSLLNKQYLDKKALDPQKLFYGAISGMVSAAGDPYTFFLPPEVQKSSKEDLNGSFEGVGIQLGFNDDKRLVVVAPLSGTPAEKAGIKPQDLIVKIDDKDTNGITLVEAVKQIRGLKGTKVKLTIFRDGEEDTRDFELTRDTIVVKSVEIEFKDLPDNKKAAVLKLSRFGERTNEEWQDAVTEALKNNVSGVVLDMRNNPGGFMEGAVHIASEFLDGGDVVLQEDTTGNRVSLKVSRLGQMLKTPLVVLINKGSASASEIVAGALQDRKRAKLVGEKSFGKGTIQEAQELPGNTGIHITVAKWLTPNGRWVNDLKGLDPDVKVELEKESSQSASKTDDKKDLQLEKALELLN